MRQRGPKERAEASCIVECGRAGGWMLSQDAFLHPPGRQSPIRRQGRRTEYGVTIVLRNVADAVLKVERDLGKIIDWTGIVK